jgi:ABC-type multidrug transport system ATPase subunit
MCIAFSKCVALPHMLYAHIRVKVASVIQHVNITSDYQADFRTTSSRHEHIIVSPFQESICMAVAYSINNLTKIYKGLNHKANDQITLNIRQGEIFGLLGPNGAGKSTLINQLTGLIRPTSGSIRLFGIDIVKRPHIIPDYVSLQSQRLVALRDLYAEEALQYTGQLRGCSSADAHQQTNALIEEMGLGDFRHRLIRQLSGGQARLLNLSLAFIGNKPIQIFDEPTNDLDPVVRKQVWEKMLRLHQDGITIIIVTHNVMEAERVIQRVGIINHGQLLAVGAIGELKARVDQRIRLELILKPEHTEYHKQFASLGEVRSLSEHHWMLLCYRETTREAIDHILTQIGLDKLEDFRILTPSLEDVYLQLGGGTKLD